MKKNVYQGYLSSAEVRSSSERKFEKFCEKCDAVEWVYKMVIKAMSICPSYMQIIRTSRRISILTI